MRRKLTFATLLSLSVASPVTWALGVGDVEVRSSLDAPLEAVIPLVDVADLEPHLLKVSLAEATAFERAGLERTPLAASVDMAVRQRRGRWVVELTSERPVREPWLDLLLRFDWPDGRLLREVTLLLDPPNYDELPVLAGSPSRPAQVADPGPVPASSTTAGDSRSSATPSSDAGRGATWVGSGDTLWSVASRLRPDASIGMDQMMVALIEANPEVFPSGNINAMRAGHTLAVPSREAILSRSAEEADRIVAAMNQAWSSRDSGAPAPVSLQGAAVSRDVASAPVTQDGPSGGASSAPETAGAATEPDEPPRLTLLSDAELAAEAAARTAPDENEPAPPATALDPDIVAHLASPELALMSDASRLEARWQERRQALEAERDALHDELGGLREELDALRTQMAALLAERAAESSETAVVAPATDGRDDEREAPWWGAVYPAEAEGRLLLLGGAGIAALLGLWLLVRWRRHRHEPATAGSFATLSTVSPATAEPDARADMASMVGEAMAFDLQEQPSMPQAEAINEADIFMAYGRYDQARELLEAGIARDPSRQDLRFKLLTVCVEQGDRHAAEREARWLRDNAEPALVGEVERLMARQAPDGPASLEPSEPAPPRAFEADEPAGETPGRAAPAAEPEAPAGLTTRHAETAAGDDAREGETQAAAGAVEETPGDDQAVSPARDDDWPTLPMAFDTEPRQPSEDEGEWYPDEEGAAPTAGNDEAEPAPDGFDPAERAPNVIDYQPPALDPEPAAREETPMQPSVEFTPPDGAVSPGETTASAPVGPGEEPVEFEEAGDAGPGEPLPGLSPTPEEEWEVEEVAFPPLDDDNGRPFNADVAGDSLDEARQLMADGEKERARALLQRLLVESDDDELRNAARSLIDHHRL
ncbi:hypothetical protein EQG41_04630 [Billgrantia azerbaijanica]|nr:hypothetical protein EQG41_04630 [Halomonas azerbaijanica]